MPINPLEPVSLKFVVTLRPVRGNLATKHDRSPAKLEKTLRGQFGSFYDQKKIGNTYWRWPERNLSGNTIDFLVQILGLSFHDAMTKITAS
jgi:hypothetical protein